MDNEIKDLPRQPIEIINGAAAMFEQLQPEVLAHLGNIANLGASKTDLQWMDELNDATERAFGALDAVFRGINGVGVRPITKSVETAPQGEETSYQETPIVPEPSEDNSDSPATTEPEDIHSMKDEKRNSEIVSALRLSDNERSAATLALNYLESQSEQQGLKAIITAVFGRSRLPNNEEARFVEILSGYADYGILNRYGNSFRYRTSEERLQSDLSIENSPEEGQPLTEFEVELVEFIASHSQDDKINVGQMVREYVKVDTMPQDEFHSLVAQLNNLADRGYLSHEKRSSWYGLGDRATHNEQQKQLPHVETPAINSDLHLDEDSPAPAEAGSSANETVLSDRLNYEILEYAKKSGSFRIEELRSGLPSLSSLTDKEYQSFKLNFPNIRNQIIDFLSSQSINARWEESGQRRGKRYGLVSDSSLETVIILPPDTALELDLSGYTLSEREEEMTRAIISSTKVGNWFRQKDVSLEGISFASPGAQRQAFGKLMAQLVSAGLFHTDGARGGKKYALAAEPSALSHQHEDVSSTQQVTDTVHPPSHSITHISSSEIGSIAAEQKILDRRTMTFAQRLVDQVTNLLDAEGKRELSVVREVIAKQLGIEPDEARELIGQLVGEGHFYFNGEKGKRVITAKKPGQSASEHRARKSRESEKWSDQDVMTALRVFSELLELTHVQQGFTVKKLLNKLEINEEQEGEFRQLLRKMENGGYLFIDRNANPNTRSSNSRRIYVPVVKLGSQQLKDRLKSNHNELRKELSLLTGATQDK